MGIGHLIMGYFVNVGNDTLINLEKLKNKNYRYIIDSVLNFIQLVFDSSSKFIKKFRGNNFTPTKLSTCDNLVPELLILTNTL
jgi:hypothetical protein